MESEWWVVGWLLGEPVSGHFDMLSKQTCCDTKSRNGRKISAPFKDGGRIKARQESKVLRRAGRGVIAIFGAGGTGAKMKHFQPPHTRSLLSRSLDHKAYSYDLA